MSSVAVCCILIIRKRTRTSQFIRFITKLYCFITNTWLRVIFLLFFFLEFCLLSFFFLPYACLFLILTLFWLVVFITWLLKMLHKTGMKYNYQLCKDTHRMHIQYLQVTAQVNYGLGFIFGYSYSTLSRSNQNKGWDSAWKGIT